MCVRAYVRACVKTSKNLNVCILGITRPIELKIGLRIKLQYNFCRDWLTDWDFTTFVIFWKMSVKILATANFECHEETNVEERLELNFQKKNCKRTFSLQVLLNWSSNPNSFSKRSFPEKKKSRNDNFLNVTLWKNSWPYLCIIMTRIALFLNHISFRKFLIEILSYQEIVVESLSFQNNDCPEFREFFVEFSINIF